MKKTRKDRNKKADAGSGNYRFPRRDVEKDAVLVGLQKEGQPRRVSQRGRVLVMDDEDVIRSILSVMLLAFGYEAQLTSDGEEAIRCYEKAMAAGDPFDAVIIDLNIPSGTGGNETIRRLREIDPGVRAIVSSGYRNNPAVENYREYGFLAVLHKPYSISQLRNVLNDVRSCGPAERPSAIEGHSEREINLQV